jgi:hypothetical protein
MGMQDTKHLRTRKAIAPAAVVLAAALFFVTMAAQAQTSANSRLAKDAKQVPVVDGGAGPCSVDFTVTDANSRPVYAATIKVHVAYGFLGSHRLDLQVGTNYDGKARFTGLPKQVKDGTFYFVASQGGLSGVSIYAPTKTCTASQTIVLVKPAQQQP